MQQLPFKAFVSDLDGTLLNHQHRIGDYTIETLNKLEEKGVDIILATGRNHTDVASILEKIGSNNARMITSNGARIRDLQGNIIYSNNLPEALALELYQIPFDTSKICLNTYQDEGWFIDRDVPELEKYHQDSGLTYQIVDFKTHHARGVEKVFFIAENPQDLRPLEDELRARYGDKTAIVYSAPTCLEIMNKGVSKGDALAHLLENKPYELKDCIAFGDGLNDVEMLSRVGKGCLMQEADPRLKAACPDLEQIGSYQDEAVAHYVCDLFGVK